MQLEFYDVMFFIRSLKGPTNAFNVDDHVTFHTGSTRSSTHLKLKHVLSRTNSARHFYFNISPRLGNSLPTIYLDLSTKLRAQWFVCRYVVLCAKIIVSIAVLNNLSHANTLPERDELQR